MRGGWGHRCRPDYWPATGVAIPPTTRVAKAEPPQKRSGQAARLCAQAVTNSPSCSSVPAASLGEDCVERHETSTKRGCFGYSRSVRGGTLFGLQFQGDGTDLWSALAAGQVELHYWDQ